MGAGAGFGVVLDAEDGQVGVAEAFDGAVVEVDVGDDAAAGFEALLVDGEAVVLAGDLDSAGVEVLDRLVAAAVAELELVGARRRWPGRGAGGRGRCRRWAACPSTSRMGLTA